MSAVAEDPYIVYVKFVKAPLHEFFKTISAVTDLVKLVCKSKYIAINCVNVARSVSASAMVSACAVYRCSLPTECVLPLKIEQLNIMLSNTKKTDEYVVLYVLRSKPTVFCVGISDSERQEGMSFRDEYFFNIDEDDGKDIETLRDQTHVFQATIDATWFKNQLSSVHRLKDTKVDFTYDQDGPKMSLIMEAFYSPLGMGKKLEMCNTKDAITAADPTATVIVKGTYSLADLQDAASCPADNKKLILCIAQDGEPGMQPLILTYSVPNIGLVKFAIKTSERT